jgi:acyl-CoA synthetase (AMP-forming)/AMP-acid ligase II
VQLVHQFLEQQAAERPHAVLVVEGKTQVTYGEMEMRANAIAHLLLAQGINRGDRIGLLAVNSAEYVASYYGIIKAGGVVVALNAAADGHTQRPLLELCTARGLVCGRRMGRRAEGVEHLPGIEFVMGWRGEWADRCTTAQCRFVDQAELAQANPHLPDVRLDPTERAAIVYTSGSTGKPKGAVLRHSNIVANTCSIIQYLELSPRDRVMVVLPFHYVYGKSLLNTHVAVGGSVVIENGFLFPQRALDTLERTHCTGFSGVPSTFAILMNRSTFATREFSHLRYITQAGGAMAPDLQRRLIEALPGKQIFIMYGATEGSARLSYLPPEDLPRKLGSIGKAIPGVTLRVQRDDGSEADVDEVGELVAQGENIMEGYWDDPEETASVLDADGYHTGDLAMRDSDGFLYIVGRSREMIKSGAHRIAPKEIEEILQEHPDVHEAAVVGVPDEILGEAVAAFISGRADASPDEQRIIDWCRRRLPAHKVPGLLRVIEDFERNASGKINKLVLGKTVEGEQAGL